MGYRIIDHTADVAADLDARSPGELFASAAQAPTDTMTPLEGVRPSVTQPVTLDAATLEDEGRTGVASLLSEVEDIRR